MRSNQVLPDLAHWFHLWASMAAPSHLPASILVLVCGYCAVVWCGPPPSNFLDSLRNELLQFELPVTGPGGETIGVIQHYHGNEPEYTARHFCTFSELDCDEDDVDHITDLIRNKQQEWTSRYNIPAGAKEVDLLATMTVISETETQKLDEVRNQVAGLREEQATMLAHMAQLSDMNLRLMHALAASPQFAGQLGPGAAASPKGHIGPGSAAYEHEGEEIRLLEDRDEAGDDRFDEEAGGGGGGAGTGASAPTSVVTVDPSGVATHNGPEAAMALSRGHSSGTGMAVTASVAERSSPCYECLSSVYQRQLLLLSDALPVRRTACSERLETVPEAALAAGPGDSPLGVLRTVETPAGLGELLSQLELTGEGAVVGVRAGATQGAFAASILGAWDGRKLHVVGPWGGSHAGGGGGRAEIKALVGKLGAFSGRYSIIRKPLSKAATQYDVGELGFVVLAGQPTTYAWCRRALQQWSRTIMSGGIIAGRGYSTEYDPNGGGPGVGAVLGCRDAVDEFAAVHNLRVRSSGTTSASLWYMMWC